MPKTTPTFVPPTGVQILPLPSNDSPSSKASNKKEGTILYRVGIDENCLPLNQRTIEHAFQLDVSTTPVTERVAMLKQFLTVKLFVMSSTSPLGETSHKFKKKYILTLWDAAPDERMVRSSVSILKEELSLLRKTYLASVPPRLEDIMAIDLFGFDKRFMVICDETNKRGSEKIFEHLKLNRLQSPLQVDIASNLFFRVQSMPKYGNLTAYSLMPLCLQTDELDSILLESSRLLSKSFVGLELTHFHSIEDLRLGKVLAHIQEYEEKHRVSSTIKAIQEDKKPTTKADIPVANSSQQITASKSLLTSNITFPLFSDLLDEAPDTQFDIPPDELANSSPLSSTAPSTQQSPLLTDNTASLTQGSKEASSVASSDTSIEANQGLISDDLTQPSAPTLDLLTTPVKYYPPAYPPYNVKAYEEPSLDQPKQNDKYKPTPTLPAPEEDLITFDDEEPQTVNLIDLETPLPEHLTCEANSQINTKTSQPVTHNTIAMYPILSPLMPPSHPTLSILNSRTETESADTSTSTKTVDESEKAKATTKDQHKKKIKKKTSTQSKNLLSA